MTKIVIDKSKCIGCGMCVSLASKTFKIGKDMKSEVVNQKGDLQENVQNAVNNCPVGAISQK